VNVTVILVCGGRGYTDQAHVDKTLDAARAHYGGDLLVVQGGATGADRCAARWATSRGQHYAHIPALWGRYAKGAGPKRNTAMVALAPALSACLAFPGGTGTADMVAKARQAGVPTYEV
jgi:predicted Rossmann-fold nucleotide-binding protein